MSDLQSLTAYRNELGPELFADLLTHAAAGDTDLAETITSLLGQIDPADDDTP